MSVVFSPIFAADTKIIFHYHFVARLKKSIKVWYKPGQAKRMNENNQNAFNLVLVRYFCIKFLKRGSTKLGTSKRA